jgi:hypothetical protein
MVVDRAYDRANHGVQSGAVSAASEQGNLHETAFRAKKADRLETTAIPR